MYLDLHFLSNTTTSTELVRDFNVKVAIYREKLISIADFGDCSHFRHEVRRYRRKCLEAAKTAKTKLYPHMRGCRTRPEFERLFIQLTGCMEMYVNEMIKSLILLQILPVDALRVPGVVESSDVPNKGTWPTTGKPLSNAVQGSDRLKGERTISEHMEDSMVIDAPITIKDDLEQICVDIRHVQAMLREVDHNELLPRQRTPDGSAFISEVLPVSGVGKMRRRLIWCCCSKPL
ncbi:regulator of G-protein signaling 7-binding protein-like [Lytechinus variegatus]|uniref:regulator of G-protein signaling 7-binding protein-like n=1 Tax=Lytechinus variegatus TaxID=7654 RepID=UPI001BB11E17|nr:regulator of G-protein signaling 7-binding protein-like [Lytechinus variegatus]